jgi:hypothetical protein
MRVGRLILLGVLWSPLLLALFAVALMPLNYTKLYKND